MVKYDYYKTISDLETIPTKKKKVKNVKDKKRNKILQSYSPDPDRQFAQFQDNSWIICIVFV